MGFEPQIKKILIDIRPDRQTVMTRCGIMTAKICQIICLVEETIGHCLQLFQMGYNC